MTESTARYDRQLRIWGSHGQRRLESARVCVISSGPTSAETLKNLVLGGLSSFTLIDDAVVAESDFGNNYLVGVKGIGMSRGKVVAQYLGEFNENVVASVVMESVKEVLEKGKEFFRNFTLVISSQLTSSQTKHLAKICEQLDISLINVKSYGLMGYLQASLLQKLYAKEVCVVESKPEDQVPDLRLGCPWTELLDFAKSFHLEALDDVQHAHLPYIVVLLQSLEIWKKTNSNNLPSTSSEKEEFKSIIHQLKRRKEDPSFEEENFEEALRSAYQIWTPYAIPQSVREILEDPNAILSQNSSEFWILVHALKKFVEETGFLPLNGTIPDMTATTEFYLKLQKVFHNKFQNDMERISTFVRESLQSIGRPTNSILPDSISLFCKNSRNLRLVRSRPNWLLEDPELVRRLRNKEEFKNLSFGMLLEAADLFYEKHARYPGVFTSDEWTDDTDLLISILNSSHNLSPVDKELRSELHTIALEVCRWGATELHTVGAVMGGMASQEAIKILTNQFVPLNGTLYYNAMDSTTTVLSSF